MLLPEDYSALSEYVRELVDKFEYEMLADIARRIRGAEGQMTNSAEWQLIRLRELGAADDYVKRRLATMLEMSIEELEALYDEAAQKSARFDDKLMNVAGRNAESALNQPFIRQFIKAAKTQAGDELKNLTRTTAFRLKDSRVVSVQEAYVHAMDYTQWQIATGGFDGETAIKQAVKELADSGIKTVSYQSGLTRSIEAAVRNCVLTGISQITGQISTANADALGTDIVEVSAHPGARPSHAEWQGKWYSLRGDTEEYPNLARITGYGKPDGLKGPHCRHDFHPVLPGISVPSYTDSELDALNNPPSVVYDGTSFTYYEATQKQRQIERNIRTSKRRCIAYQAADLDEDYRNESIRLNRLNRAYHEFSAQTGLVLQNHRTVTAGWGRKEAQKARKTANSANNVTGGV